jgi:hypothetical protein
MNTTATKAKAETAIETVTMDDGRVVDFAGKRKLLKEAKVVDGKVQVRLDFRNGETRLFVIPDAMLNQFAGHGAEQKLGDETAGLDNVEDAVLAVDELMDRLQAGEWGIRRDAKGLAGTSILLKALMEVYNKPVATIKKFLSDKTPAQKMALRNDPRVKPVVAKLEEQRAAGKPTVDTSALLGELDDGASA